MTTFSRFVCAVSLAATACAAWAGATKTEAVAQVNAALAHVKKVGPEQGVKDLNAEAAWKANGMNVTMTDDKGVVHAASLNEKLRGKGTLEMKDPTGKQFVKEALALCASKGEGWVDYQFINPETKALEDRSMFVKRLPSGTMDGYIGVSIARQ